jgi:hypothetical protein
VNKVKTICLSCGKVQVRTDIIEELNDKYIILTQKKMCPKCQRETKQVATKNIKTLVKKLDISNNQDKKVLSLIGR